jgi:hypothetical protein
MFPGAETLFESQFHLYQNQVPPEKQRVTKLKEKGRNLTVQPLDTTFWRAWRRAAR